MYNYVIAIPNHPISSQYFMETVPVIEDITGNQCVMWPATTPENMPDFLKFRRDKPPTYATDYRAPMTETEKAVWYSHYFLWKHMFRYNEDAWIFEHDADLSRMPIWPEVQEHVGIAFCRDYGSMFGYFVRAEVCEILVDCVERIMIIGQIDTWMYDYVTQFMPRHIIPERYNMDVNQLTHYGTTINH